ncbi:hypothetical protein BXZ70DRAFT_1063135 [Cristinia sonorae]|uniref:Uncharacterized protein n=1 Tax=Cristinia sonorae TaxID=1940300 RepID=A0A8K0UUT1_9AGAR|nr:hypothetical protein BXZ70DRAFT_1063135 [Cristinia sonorae]
MQVHSLVYKGLLTAMNDPHTPAVSSISSTHDHTTSSSLHLLYFPCFIPSPMMRTFTLISSVAVFILGTQVLAAPMELHSIAKRASACSTSVRGPSNKDCLENNQGTNITLTGHSTISSVNVTSIPSGSTCNQLVEIQVLHEVLQSTKFCNLANHMRDAKKGLSTDKILKPLTDILNSHENLNFVDNAVEKKKKDVVEKAMKGKSQSSEDLTKAVGNYLQLTNGTSSDIAKKLDDKLADVVKDAEGIISGMDTKSAANRLKKNNLQAAVDLAKKSTTPVTDAWKKVLSFAPHS